MLEKKGISSRAGQDAHQQPTPIVNHAIEELPEEEDGGTLTLTLGGYDLASAPSSNKSNSSIFHQGTTKGDLSGCSTAVPVNGRGNKSKDYSYHSSDEIIDEENLLLVSDTDNGIPIIPGMISTASDVDGDVDSAFEDSVYSGSSDDKNKCKGNVVNKPVMKNKSRRRSVGGGRQCGATHHVPSKCENISEIVAVGNEEDTESKYKQIEDKQLYQGQMPFGGDEQFHHCNDSELTLFDMEVSPQVMPALQDYHESHENGFNTADFPYPLSIKGNRKGSFPNRHVHYLNDPEEEGKLSLDDGTDRDLDQESLQTILLPPPLEMEVHVQLSPPESEIQSPLDNLTSSLTSASGEALCPAQFAAASPLSSPVMLLDSGGVPVEKEADVKPSLFISEAGFERQARKDGETVLSIGNSRTEFRRGSQESNGGVKGHTYETGPDGDFEVVYVVPDGGYGWMVLFGSIIVNILIPGTVKSFGILFVEFLEVFNASPAAAAWIPALSYWLYSSMGPFAGALATKYSHRSVTIVGGILAASGLMLSYFATSIPYLYVSYGLIGGLGAGLAYPIGVFMVGQYFEKRRGLANGLCMSGSALGSVLVPPLLRVLLSEYGYRGAILIMGGILLNVCVGAMFYDPVSKHMKRTLVPRDKSKIVEEQDNDQKKRNLSPQEAPTSPAEQPISYPQRQVTNPIPRTVKAPMREIAASLPIAIPLPPQNITDFRDVTNRRGSNGGRKATFQIGHEDDSWSYKSNELASPLAARLVKEDHSVGPNSPNRWGFYNPRGITVRGHLPCNNNDSNPELETLITSTSTGAMPTSGTGVGGTALSLSGVGASRGQSRLNLTAIPEDDDTASESASRQVDWTFYSALPAAKQRLLRLSVSSGTQLMGSGSHSAHPSAVGLVNQAGLSRTMSVASNVSNSSFNYVSTIHHGSLLMAMQYDKNLPEFASTLTLKSMRESCCPKMSTLKEVCRKLTCGLWPKREQVDEQDTRGIVKQDLLPPKTKKPGFGDRMKKFIDFSLLRDGMYLIMLFSNSTTAVGYTNFIVLLPSYARDMGFGKSEAASLLSIVAALDFVGRISGAALSDLQFISRRWYYIVGLFLSGVALSLLPLARTYSSLLAMCAAFGLASGTYIGVTAVILADQLGAEKLGSSYGISLFLNGLLQLIGPPVCGALNQHIGNLEPIFTGLGITLICGALLWIFAPFIERRRAQKETAKREMENTSQVDVVFEPQKKMAVGEAHAAQFVQNANDKATTARSETSVV